MRQVFRSPRLENVEGVAKLLRDADIEVYISDGRSYKDGQRRGGFSYRDGARERPDPALWIVKAEDQPRAREILRNAGLLASTRPGQTDAVQDIPVFASREPPRGGLNRTRILLYMAVIVAVGMAVLRQCSG